MMRISTGQYYESNNGGRTGSGLVRVVSYKAPTVRYAQVSYDGAICAMTERVFLDNYKPISEALAQQMLNGKGVAHGH